MKLNVGQIQGLSGNSNTVTIPEGTILNFTGGSNLDHTANTTSHFPTPYGTEAEWNQRMTDHRKEFVDGQIRYNQDENRVEIYYGGAWYIPTNTTPNPGSSTGTVGTQSNPAISGMEILAQGSSSGLYWIQPEGESQAYEMYVNNTDNGGGWVLCAHVRTSTCQDHITTGAVRISGTTGPRTNNTSTTKMADSFINNLRNSSSYTGSTAYWMHATGFNKHMFIDSGAWVHLSTHASDNNARTRVSTSYQGSLSDRGPNSGTRGFGDHHTSGGTYFAWGRHPEQGSNCGFREDSLGASNGYLWVK